MEASCEKTLLASKLSPNSMASTAVLTIAAISASLAGDAELDVLEVALEPELGVETAFRAVESIDSMSP
jgi:hypothetical protein